LEEDGNNAAEFLCLPGVSLEMSRLFLERLAARDPEAEHVVIFIVEDAGALEHGIPLIHKRTFWL